VIIGTEEHSTPAGSFAGSAYIFQREEDSWEQTQELIANDGTADAKFGCSVALDGKTILVGAGPQSTAAGVSAGEANILQLFNAWPALTMSGNSFFVEALGILCLSEECLAPDPLSKK
jgi:hypothetical protein